MAVYTIESWLRGKVDLDFPSEAISAILYERGVAAGTDMGEVSVRTRELCYADLLMYAAGSSVSSSGEYVSDNGYQLQKSMKNVYDRKALRDLAQKIYGKYGDPKADDAAGGGFRLKNLY